MVELIEMCRKLGAHVALGADVHSAVRLAQQFQVGVVMWLPPSGSPSYKAS